MAKKTIKETELINQEKLNLACGQVRVEGFFGVDYVKTDSVDAVVDLEVFPWSIASESASEIICSHYVEHTSDLIKFMEEVYRILKPEGTIKVIAPYYNSIRCWQDPTHKRAISEATFLYFNKAWRDMNKLDHYGITCNFDYTYGYDIAQEWATREQSARDFAIRHYTNVINDIHIVLTKKA